MPDVGTALRPEVLDVAQAQREAGVHHHHEADNLGRGVEVAESVVGAPQPPASEPNQLVHLL
jgi:hypothetical protein